jgi:uncharacterized membrane protein
MSKKEQGITLEEINKKLEKIVDLLEKIAQGMPITTKRAAELEEVLKTGVLDAVTLLSVPDHLRKTLVALAKLGGEGTSEDVAKATSRARAVESAYLNQLVALGYVIKKRRGRRVFFIIPQLKGEEEE